LPPPNKTRPVRNDELINVAATLFSERGYDATSMQDIAERMGILKGSLYHYVRTKEDLLWSIIEPPLRDLVERAEQILGDTGQPLAQRIAAVMRAHAENFEDNHPHMFVMARENGATLSSQRRREYDSLRRRYSGALREAIATGQASGEIRSDLDPSIAVHGIFGMLNWMFRWFDPGGRLQAREVATQFAATVIQGLVVATPD
jgi:AcrR family transcriptional regulator